MSAEPTAEPTPESASGSATSPAAEPTAATASPAAEPTAASAGSSAGASTVASAAARTASPAAARTAASAGAPAVARVKPRLRGVLHLYAFFASLLPGALLVISAPTHRAAVAAGLYAASLAALLGTSALYHCVHWEPRARFWLGRLDLAMIFVLIAGTYTPIAVLALDPPLSTIVLTGTWLLALAGSILKVFWVNASKAANAAVYVAVGSLAVLFLPQTVEALGIGGALLFGVGGVLYIAGAVVYGLQRPDPHPAVFGYHEIFHGLVVVAAAVHFAAVAIYVVPASG